MTATLYELGDALAILNAQIEERAAEIAENGGALPEDLAALLDDAEGSFDEKVERVALYIKECEGHAHAVSLERDRLADRVRMYDARVTSLKAYLLAQMQKVGKDKVERPRATVTMVTSSPSVSSSLDQSALYKMHEKDSPFVRYVPATVALDKVAIVAAFKRDGTVPEGVTVQSGHHLRIR